MRRSFADTEAPLALAPQSTFEPVEIALWGLTYDVDGTRLLDGVTARFDHGQSAAVLGPSGAGKSTLLGVLGGHAGGNVGGALRLNGVAPSAAEQRFASSTLPQDDFVHGALTVRHQGGKRVRHSQLQRLLSRPLSTRFG